MQAKLVKPRGDKNWSIHFFNLPKGDHTSVPLRANIWYWSQYYGKCYHTRPFLQGDSGDWMMIEFWTKSQRLILETCLAVCEELNVELEL